MVGLTKARPNYIADACDVKCDAGVKVTTGLGNLIGSDSDSLSTGLKPSHMSPVSCDSYYDDDQRHMHEALSMVGHLKLYKLQPGMLCPALGDLGGSPQKIFEKQLL